MRNKSRTEHRHIAYEANGIPDLLPLLDDGWEIVWSGHDATKFYFIIARTVSDYD